MSSDKDADSSAEQIKTKQTLTRIAKASMGVAGASIAAGVVATMVAAGLAVVAEAQVDAGEGKWSTKY